MEKPEGKTKRGTGIRTDLYGCRCRCMTKLLAPVDYGQKITLCDGIEVRFNDVGHLLGSASIEVWVTEGEVSKKIVFSGDVGNKNQPIIKDPQLVKKQIM